jgi:hypothetical protein
LIAQQLEPFEAAESQLRFAEVDCDELEADYREMIDQTKSEASDEESLNAALASVIDQLKKISSEMPDFDRNDLAIVQREAIPSMQKQLDEINGRDADSKRKVIERRWPSSDINPSR